MKGAPDIGELRKYSPAAVFGHVNNAAYLEIFEEARGLIAPTPEWLSAVGMTVSGYFDGSMTVSGARPRRAQFSR